MKKHSDSRLSITDGASNASASETDIPDRENNSSDDRKADVTENSIGDVCENSKTSGTEYKEKDSKDGKDVCDNE